MDRDSVGERRRGVRESSAFDFHKHDTQVLVEDGEGRWQREVRLAHERVAIQPCFASWTPGSPVAVETVGTWDGIVDEIEAAGLGPRLVPARKAKVMMGSLNKTDKLDARGLNRLQRTGPLPVVWIPGATLRDQRDLARTRMGLGPQRSRLKTRIHATVAT
ncbi:IS110 family transposase [Nitrospira sp. Kam-Ns4a]